MQNNIMTERPKILMVDDKPENLLVLEKLLSSVDADLYKATSGNDALALTLENDFVLVLLDVQMPGMDGYEVLDMMSWNERTKYTPVIFITANYADEKHQLKGYEYGAVDFLFKPVNKQILLGKVNVFIELYQQRLEYKKLHQRYELILNAAGEGVFGLDTNGIINFINPAAASMLKRSADKLINQPFQIMLPPSEDDSQPPFIWENSDIYLKTKDGEIFPQNDDFFLKADGTLLPVEYKASPLHNEHGDYIGIVLVFSDITLRKTVEEQLTHMALYDHLTELPNRILFEKTMLAALSRAERYNRFMAVMFLDLDHFKTINDTLGHDIGDMLLKGVSERLRKSVRQSDMVARLGGDEFAIILEEILKPEDAALVAEKAIDALKPPFFLGEHEVFTSTSIGIAVYPMSGQDLTTLTKNADIAMYRSKHHGRNGYRFFTTGMNQQSMHRLNLAHNLRLALEKSEFFLCYQPKLELQTNIIAGVEALIRWRHPQLGVIYPNEFIHIAEEIGIMNTLGEWVIRTCCQDILAWEKEGITLQKVAVNLSSSQLTKPQLSATVQHILEETGAKSSSLELELTETTIMVSPDLALETLKKLHDLGVCISIDDFGTGYSSLSYLKRLPVDTLKIDQSFIRDINQDTNGVAIIKAIIALGHSLGLIVIAEGVETEEQLAFLREVQCNQIQGYICSEPLTSKELIRFLKTNNYKLI